MHLLRSVAESTPSDRAIDAIVILFIFFTLALVVTYILRWNTDRKLNRLRIALDKVEALIPSLEELKQKYENAETDEEREEIQKLVDAKVNEINGIIEKALEN